jgi:putative transposase
MSVFLSLLLTLRRCARSRAVLQLEVLALRHQLQVLQRSRPRRLRLAQTDRLLWVWLSRVWDDWRAAVVIVKPETVIAWHRRAFLSFWSWKSRRQIGRSPVPSDVRALIRRMSDANPRWGAPRIHGELLKLGIEVSQSTVPKYLGRRQRPPSQTWRTFLANHVGQIMAADFFVVPTATGRLLFVLVILAHARRRIVRVAVTEHPTAAWTSQQRIRNSGRTPRSGRPSRPRRERPREAAAQRVARSRMKLGKVSQHPRKEKRPQGRPPNTEWPKARERSDGNPNRAGEGASHRWVQAVQGLSLFLPSNRV